MQVTESVVGLNVDDVGAVSAFLCRHFGFTELMAFDGFASLGRPDAGMTIALHRRGLEVLPAEFRNQPTSGVLIAFAVTDLAAEQERLRAEGANITLPMREEPWGERVLLVTGPDGVVVELCDFPERDQASAE